MRFILASAAVTYLSTAAVRVFRDWSVGSWLPLLLFNPAGDELVGVHAAKAVGEVP